GSSQNIIQSSENPKTITGNASQAGNMVGTVGNIVTNVASTLGQFYSASLMPNIGSSQNTGDVNYSAKRNTFTFRKMRAKKEYIMENIERSKNTRDVKYSAKRNIFTFRKMRAKKEYLEAIDEFFSMYGYKVNLVKKPNITGRQNWNYVKTIGCNLTGNIPQM